jgi:hypothetical protein
MTDQGFFAVSPFEQRRPYYSIGAVIFAMPLFWNIYTLVHDQKTSGLIPWPLVIGLSIAGIIISFTSLFMVRKTEKGIKAKTAFLGLKEYIQTAESDRIKFVLDNNINAYHTLLPFAALFDSLDRWIAPLNALGKNLEMPQFKNITDTISAMDVDVSITEKSRWLRTIIDLFIFGIDIANSFMPAGKRYVDTDIDDSL